MLLILAITGITFSKYISILQGDVIGDVAKWSFKSNDANNGIATITLQDETREGTSLSKKIAPGTSGEFDIIIDATGSEVDVEYTTEILSESNKPTNLYFTVEGSNTKYFKLSELLSDNFAGTIDAESNNQKVEKTISWNWPYETENGDEIDTIEGMKGVDYTFSLKVTGTQVNS